MALKVRLGQRCFVFSVNHVQLFVSRWGGSGAFGIISIGVSSCLWAGQGDKEVGVLIRVSQVVLMVKNPLATAGNIKDADLIPGSGRSPGGRHGNPLQYSCLENPMDRGAWRATVHGVATNRVWQSDLASMHARGDHNDGQWHLPQAGLREGMNRRVTSKDVLEVSGVKVLMEVGCCLAVC